MSKLHRWALLDKSGKTRGTCTTSGKANATHAFKEVRKNRAIPKGWTIVDRGPVEDDTLALAADPTPEPRAFKVGDRVEWIGGPTFNGKMQDGTTGEVKRLFGIGSFAVDWDEGKPWKDHTFTKEGAPSLLRLLPPAPQPKAEEGKRLTTVDLAEKFTNELGEALGERTPWSDMVARVATLKSEVERLNHSLSDARSECVENYHQFSAAKARAETAEAKLDDIKALSRANTIMAAMPGEPTFGEAIEHVIGGAA